jgi:predicted DNA-binding mobile mystery protein A
MSVKEIARQQYQRLVDASADFGQLTTPPEGWLRTVRRALGMTGAELAKRLRVTRMRISQAEASERTGAITLKSMQVMAEAMGCRFVYAIVPPGHIEDVIVAQARKKAEALVNTASKHMALESQVLPPEKIEREIERLTQQYLRDMPSDFWANGR